ncbi:hypothetical protein, partial [Burkholderia ubonensis]|uniref:hypothetical protein n=1 Tax=Burkholderia ubonensis TaxID=101571 RepID=UPI001E52D304
QVGPGVARDRFAQRIVKRQSPERAIEEARQYGADNYLLNLFKDECEKRSDPGDDLQREHAARPKPHRANESTESEDLA